MKTETAEVKSRRKSGGETTEVVGVAEYKVYDSTAEAAGDIGEEKCLELINAQVRTNELNRVRSLAVGEPSSKALRNEALVRMTAQDWQDVAGDPDKIERRLNEKIEEIRQERLAAPAVTEG